MPPKKPTLSPSRITTYLACPMKYLWTYVDARGKWYLRAKSYYSFGSTLHKVLERFHDSGDAGVTTVGDALRIYEESWIDAGYSSPEEMQEAYGEGRDIILENLEDQAFEKAPGVVTMAVEKLFKYDLGPFVLIGRIDRLDKHPNGLLEIIDYKSGRRGVDASDVECDLAMTCYQLLIKRNFPESDIRATIQAIRSKEEGRKVASASASQNELEVFENDIRVLGEQILATTLEDHAPSIKTLCEGCDFIQLCQKDPRYA